MSLEIVRFLISLAHPPFVSLTGLEPEMSHSPQTTPLDTSYACIMTATMLDTYDSQMLDYPSDLDVPMNPSVSSDVWTQEEAIMDDDAIHSSHKNTFESVEIDMEDYDGAIHTEYDMLNASEHALHPQNTAEIVDVEVYDVSQVHSPAAFPQPVPAENHTAENIAVGHLAAPEADVQKEGTESVQVAYFDGYTEAQAGAEIQHSAEPHAQVESYVQPDHHQVEDYEHVEAVNAYSVVAPTGEEAAHGDVEDVKQVTHVEDSVEVSAFQEPAVALPDIPASSNHAEPFVLHQEHPRIEEVGPDESSHEAPQVTYEDPHEISEGVYIDPPPPVLLTIEIADSIEFCLFNEPSQRSTPKPSTGGAEQGEAPIHVLLQNRPTLYYEPLSSVFDALRQDTFLSGHSPLTEGELVLDAYDLQLVMPEDNCYAREVSLHDLNMLHDGQGLSGLLRLRLRLDVPRFIIRFQQLHERVARLAMENTEENAQTVLPANIVDQPHPEDGQDEVKTEFQHPESNLEIDQVHITQSETLEGVKVPETTDVEQGHEETPRDEQEENQENESNLAYVPNPDDNAEHAETTGEEHGPTTETCEIVGAVTDTYEESTEESAENQEDGQEVETIHGETSVNEEAPAEVLPRTATPPSTHEHVPLDRNTDQNYDAEESGADLAEENHVTDYTDVDAQGDSEFNEDDLHNYDKPAPEVAGEEVPTEQPIEQNDEHGNVEPEEWYDDLDGEGEPDTTWDYEAEEQEQDDGTSIESSVTLSSKLSSKRSFHELDDEVDEEVSDQTLGSCT
ncbi:hypothetical protein AMATHDRAFT_48975 [Amanita thiersii Skay4041]|uniref:Uncharacterized protein n=1 Tax=Amanita thiersii Skay4041 TaxID=703135 RepID=A0A2A9NLA7_9AGAR|nr:hypothetical protein AMATHDRAFT_48975 [Amanita thiersii Skay4041]